jgi:hypothetical protein
MNRGQMTTRELSYTAENNSEEENPFLPATAPTLSATAESQLRLERAAQQPLMRVLAQERQRRQHSTLEMCNSLGVPHSYLVELESGKRKSCHISQPFADACSHYLAVPTVLVKLWAGRITLGDFVWPEAAGRQRLVRTMEHIIDDPIVGPLVPQALASADQSVKTFVCALYEEVTGCHDERTYALPGMVDLMQRAALLDADAEAQLQAMRVNLQCTPGNV